MCKALTCQNNPADDLCFKHKSYVVLTYEGDRVKEAHGPFVGKKCALNFIQKYSLTCYRIMSLSSPANESSTQTSVILSTMYYFYNRINQCVDMLKNHHFKRVRRMNFPEVISEYIAYLLLSKNRKINEKVKAGDLEEEIDGAFERIEIKCTASAGPISFGPTERWKKLYIFKVQRDMYMLYLINVSSNSETWKNIKLSKKNTFEDHRRAGKRPRISFDSLANQVKMELITKGSIVELLK